MTPSERVVCVWRSIVEGPGGRMRPSAAVGSGSCRRRRGAPTPLSASTRRWIRSIWSARPVAGSMSTWTALKTTGPSPTSNRVGRALMKRGITVRGANPITLQIGPVMPMSVW